MRERGLRLMSDRQVVMTGNHETQTFGNAFCAGVGLRRALAAAGVSNALGFGGASVVVGYWLSWACALMRRMAKASPRKSESLREPRWTGCSDGAGAAGWGLQAEGPP
jgi:hypothetical protein